MEQTTEVLVVGAGQAGLALSHHLQRAAVPHLLLERATEPAAAWARRYDLLRTITPNWMNGLPGLPFGGDPSGFATRDEVVAYLRRYADWVQAPVRYGRAVERVYLKGGRFVAECAGERYVGNCLVAATGPFQRPWRPEFAARCAIRQLHSDEYRNAAQLPEGRIVVVGSGNSGVQIALDIAQNREVSLARERDYSLPRRLTGTAFQALLERIGIGDRRVDESLLETEADLMEWMERYGLYDMPPDSPLGRLLAHGVDPYIGAAADLLAAADVQLLPAVSGAEADRLQLVDGREIRPDAIIWATGYRYDYSWCELPVTDASGAPLQVDGESPVNGFYFLGLRWMRRADSGLLKGVGRDAERLAEVIARRSAERKAVNE